MKLKIKTLKIITIGIVTALAFNLASPNFFDNSALQANGGLDVIWDGVEDGQPIFVVTNMLPGDSETKNVQINNGDLVNRLISVKGERTGPDDETDPKLETILDIVISENGTDLYGGSSLGGAKTVQDFFDESADENGIILSIINSLGSTSYDFEVTFPESAENEFQGKSVIFNITIGVVISENIVINEVYYQVDGDHGLDSPADRGITAGGVSISIRGNGAGSVNQAFIDIENKCKIVQTNNANITNIIGVGANTGGNSANANTGANVNVNSGNASANINIINRINQNNSASCPKVQNHEWIELFNPTEETVSLKNWKIVDNSGIARTIPGNRKLKSGQFALISRDNSTWQFWNEDPDAIKIPLGKQIGDGLDNLGDRLILKNAAGAMVDELSYGDDISVFNPSIPLVSLGASFERLVPGFDTDFASDFEERDPPTPGN